MSQRRVYTGKQPTVFMTGAVGPVTPGQEFDVLDEDVAAFDARSDVSIPPARRAAKKTGSDGEAVASVSGDGD